MKAKIFICLIVFQYCTVYSQTEIKFSGYVQPQYQYGEKDAKLKIGEANENPDKGFHRVGVRRGRIKMTTGDGQFSGVFQIDITEKGFGIKDAYLNVKDLFGKMLQLRAGAFAQPFGNNIGYSSAIRETPESAMLIQTLFPDERDLGAMITLHPPHSIFKLDAGVFSGNSLKPETDSRKDFIFRLSCIKPSDDKFNITGGISYYNGGVYQGTEKVYAMKGNKFVLNDSPANKGKFAKREYFGLDVRLSFNSSLGLSKFWGEYMFGSQPGTATSGKSPNYSVLPTSDTYIRPFNGYYMVFVQYLGSNPCALAMTFDLYDPNSKISGDEIGLNDSSQIDLRTNTFGFGALWNISEKLRLTAFYNINRNEKTANISRMSKDLKDNVFITQLQYVF